MRAAVECADALDAEDLALILARDEELWRRDSLLPPVLPPVPPPPEPRLPSPPAGPQVRVKPKHTPPREVERQPAAAQQANTSKRRRGNLFEALADSMDEEHPPPPDSMHEDHPPPPVLPPELSPPGTGEKGTHNVQQPRAREAELEELLEISNRTREELEAALVEERAALVATRLEVERIQLGDAADELSSERDLLQSSDEALSNHVSEDEVPRPTRHADANTITAKLMLGAQRQQQQRAAREAEAMAKAARREAVAKLKLPTEQQPSPSTVDWDIKRFGEAEKKTQEKRCKPIDSSAEVPSVPKPREGKHGWKQAVVRVRGGGCNATKIALVHPAIEEEDGSAAAPSATEAAANENAAASNAVELLATQDAIRAEIERVKGLSSEQHDALGKKYIDPEEIFRAIESLTILRASWVKTQRGGRLPKRGDALPPEATITVDELRTIAKASACSYGALPLIALSHFWRTKEHPDPDGETLNLVVSSLEERWDEFEKRGVTDLGIIVDWCALWQAPRTPEQDIVFKLGLKGINQVSHP